MYFDTLSAKCLDNIDICNRTVVCRQYSHCPYIQWLNNNRIYAANALGNALKHYEPPSPSAKQPTQQSLTREWFPSTKNCVCVLAAPDATLGATKVSSTVSSFPPPPPPPPSSSLSLRPVLANTRTASEAGAPSRNIV